MPTAGVFLLSDVVPEPWWHRPLDKLTRSEWEALCDGCGRCCLAKIEPEDGEGVLFTRVACRLLDTETCRCLDYTHRLQAVPDCQDLNCDNIYEIDWLPSTCAYRLRREGKPLPDWHPLLSGDGESVHDAGISVRGRVIGEQHVHPDGLEEHIVHWVESGG